MSIAENIALDVAELPTDSFEIDGPAREDQGREDQGREDRHWKHEERNDQNGDGASLTNDHGIDERAASTTAPAAHPLLDDS